MNVQTTGRTARFAGSAMGDVALQIRAYRHIVDDTRNHIFRTVRRASAIHTGLPRIASDAAAAAVIGIRLNCKTTIRTARSGTCRPRRLACTYAILAAFGRFTFRQRNAAFFIRIVNASLRAACAFLRTEKFFAVVLTALKLFGIV